MYSVLIGATGVVLTLTSAGVTLRLLEADMFLFRFKFVKFVPKERDIFVSEVKGFRGEIGNKHLNDFPGKVKTETIKF